MKKGFRLGFVPVLLLLQLYAFPQSADIKILKHQFYTSYFSLSKHIPVVVQYTLTKDMFICDEKIKRTNRFKADPLLPEATTLQLDYKASGFDRGHNMSAADNGCSELGMAECFYFSNMTPQPHFFNAGTWEDLEKLERNYATHEKLIIFTGSIGKTETIGVDAVVVPRYMWKVIYFPERKKDKYECYLFPDADIAVKPYTQYKISLEEIEEHAGIKFNGEVLSFED